MAKKNEMLEYWRKWTETTEGTVSLVKKTEPVAEGDYRVFIDNMYDFMVFSKIVNNATKRHAPGSTEEDWINNNHGQYDTIDNELEFLDVIKKSVNIVCHMYDSTEIRCSIIDKHLALLAQKHMETKFCKLHVESATFLCKFLSIKETPTLILGNGSIIMDFVRGFDDLGGVDDFPTEVLEKRLAKLPCINYATSSDSDSESDGDDDTNSDD